MRRNGERGGKERMSRGCYGDRGKKRGCEKRGRESVREGEVKESVRETESEEKRDR